jgi:hypothetical protein
MAGEATVGSLVVMAADATGVVGGAVDGADTGTTSAGVFGVCAGAAEETVGIAALAEGTGVGAASAIITGADVTEL